MREPKVVRLSDLPHEQRARMIYAGYIARIDWYEDGRVVAGRWARSEDEITNYLTNGPQIVPQVTP
jgi:hypothetical protein